ncbi:sensor domain-containing diguanylate cyclase [Salipaludibacillus sp. CF4.18]|uniref:sensor domain-containing diguanylate cyclase n=1 Tax=Salipaludibacillus sp. CF4.18 TaxID=3373081 RepID=UPI003EE4D59C
MKLKMKVFNVILICLLVFFIVLLFIIKPILLESAAKLDEHRLSTKMDNVLAYIESETDDLQRLNKDWAVWDDTYNLLLGEYPNYAGVNLQKETFTNNEVNLMIFINENSEIIEEKAMNYDTGINLELGEEFVENLSLLIDKKSNKERTLFGVTEFGLTMLSVEEVYPSNGEGDSAGLLVMGKFLETGYFDRMQKELATSFSYIEVDEAGNDGGHEISITDSTMINGSMYLFDEFNEQMLRLDIPMPRSHYMEEQSNMNMLFLSFFLASVLLTMILFYLLDRLITSRVTGLSTELRTIQATKDEKNARVEVDTSGSDEISMLKHTINDLLQTLDCKTEEVKNLAFYDQMTGLPNRYYLYQYSFKNKEQHSFYTIFMDIDGFKSVNDTYGHLVGDKLLNEFSSRLREFMKDQTGFVSRLGGDEFIILLEDMDNEKLEEQLDRLLTSLRREYRIDNTRISNSTSMGISHYPKDGESLDELIQMADKAMYQAKKNGKNRWHFYNPKPFP